MKHCIRHVPLLLFVGGMSYIFILNCAGNVTEKIKEMVSGILILIHIDIMGF